MTDRPYCNCSQMTTGGWCPVHPWSGQPVEQQLASQPSGPTPAEMEAARQTVRRLIETVGVRPSEEETVQDIIARAIDAEVQKERNRARHIIAESAYSASWQEIADAITGETNCEIGGREILEQERDSLRQQRAAAEKREEALVDALERISQGYTVPRKFTAIERDGVLVDMEHPSVGEASGTLIAHSAALAARKE